MKMSKYCIIGTGRQGTAALYDLIKYSQATEILLLDESDDSLKNCISKIDSVLEYNISISSKKINIDDSDELISLLKDVDGFLSAVPYQYNLMLTDIAIKSSTSKVKGFSTIPVIFNFQFFVSNF